jgi:hypothetical protein
MQDTDESVQRVDLTFDIKSRASEGDELVNKTYTFSYARQWDKWTFTEYSEERTPDTPAITDRKWRKSRHIRWDDFSETPTIDVPAEVSEALEEATGADDVTIQTP